MPVSPLSASEGDLRLTLYSAGTAIDPAIQVLSVVVKNAVNKVPGARIVLAEDDEVKGKLPRSDSDVFKPGNAVRIAAGYGVKETTFFEGVVVAHGLRSAGGGVRLVLECRDKVLAMTLGRSSANYVDASDGDILPRLIAAYSGLRASVEATDLKHTELVQFDATDWDFMLARAEANGMVVIVEAGKVTIAPPKTDGDAALLLTYGVDLIAFDADLDARSQLAVVDSVAWDPATQAVLTHAEKTKGSKAQRGYRASLTRSRRVTERRKRSSAWRPTASPSAMPWPRPWPAA